MHILTTRNILPKGISFVVSKYKWPLFALQILKLDANTIKLQMNVVWKILSKKRDTKLRIQKAYLKPKQCLKYIQTYKIWTCASYVIQIKKKNHFCFNFNKIYVYAGMWPTPSTFRNVPILVLFAYYWWIAPK